MTYIVQEYNSDMTELVKQHEVEFDIDNEAVNYAFDYAQASNYTVYLWRRGTLDPTRVVKLAKFY